MRQLTIVMYHYVRDLGNSNHPELKALDSHLFREQIAYLGKHYQIVSGSDVMAAKRSGDPLPTRATLLTFDDGYMDHYDEVFPVLHDAGLSGCFFPPAKCVLENDVLDVNMIHFILASVENKSEIVDFISKAVDENSEAYGLEIPAYYWNKVGKASRFDPAEVIYIKRMLQRELPEQLRGLLVDQLFQRFVTADKKGFSEQLYMHPKLISEMQSAGQYIGSHGYDHYWLNSLTKEKQAEEIDRSLEFLETVGASRDDWIMCYPYGGYNEETLDLLRQRNCRVGLTTQVGIADLDADDGLVLPRLDTNDLPKDASAPPNDWTQKVM